MESSLVSFVVVTLVVDYGTQPAVRLKMAESVALQAVECSQRGGAASRPFHGTDRDGRPFNVDVGERAVAVYIDSDNS